MDVPLTVWDGRAPELEAVSEFGGKFLWLGGSLSSCSLSHDNEEVGERHLGLDLVEDCRDSELCEALLKTRVVTVVEVDAPIRSSDL